MRVTDLLVTEIFHSLQGETSLSGHRFAFIRLTGCNLRCAYCDSAYAFKGGRRMSIDATLDEIRPYGVKHVLLTGGEPLLQRPVSNLLDALNREDYRVSIETHGEVSIREFAGRARIVMDIKTPSSGMNRGGFRANLEFLNSGDEVKFVIASETDYEWAKSVIREGGIRTGEVLLSPAFAAPGAPGRIKEISPQWLAEKILEDQLPVRMQLQMHKLIWGMERIGV